MGCAAERRGGTARGGGQAQCILNPNLENRSTVAAFGDVLGDF